MLPATAFLHAHGIDASCEDIDQAVADALERHRPALYPRDGSGLTAAEAAVLRQGGFNPGASVPDALVEGLAEHVAILRTALTTSDVAERLGVSEARVRQRLQKRTLFGVETRHGWRLPSFQFSSRGELPGWSVVAPRLPADLSAVELLGWLSSPNPDLEVGGEPTTPLDWLRSGRSARVVAELASLLS